MTEYIYRLTGEQLRDLMTLAIAKWEALDRDVTAAVEAALAEDDAKRLENSLPLVDEDYTCPDCGSDDLSKIGEGVTCMRCGWYDTISEDIPFQGEPAPYNDDDNTSPKAIGLEPVA